MTDLTGSVVVVAGATRGGGRGIAAAFGEAGATVVCTGRSSRAGRAEVVSEYAGRSETIEETAELVTALGGRGVARQVDHLEPGQVADLAAWLRDEFGGVDVLVNDVWGAEDLKGAPPEWNTPVWEHDLDVGLRILRLAIDTHLVTSHHLLPLVLARPGGLVVEVTDGTTAFNAENYRISVFYDLAKVAVNRLGWSQGHELAPHGATALSVTPGWMRSEIMLETFGVTEATWREAVGTTAPAGFAQSETPRFVGRGIAALAADPDRARWSQASVTAGELARAYGVVDRDGTQPDAWALS
jgi:NAD(P)-dependent dehydrogenase (short-subunit alcohol dehydrogenase family)